MFLQGCFYALIQPLASETFYATYDKHAICMSESYCPVWTIHHASNALTIA